MKCPACGHEHQLIPITCAYGSIQMCIDNCELEASARTLDRVVEAKHTDKCIIVAMREYINTNFPIRKMNQ